MNVPHLNDRLIHYLAVLLRGMKYVLLFAVSTLLVGILAVSALVGSQWGREVLLDKTVQQISSLTPLNIALVDVRSESISQWNLGQLALSYQGHTLAKLNEIELNFPGWSLFERDIKIESLSFGSLYLEIDPKYWPEFEDDLETKEIDPDLPEWLNAWRLELARFSAPDVVAHHASLSQSFPASLDLKEFSLANLAMSPPNIRLEELDFDLGGRANWLKASVLNDSISGQLKLDNFPLDLVSNYMDGFDGGLLSADLKLGGELISPHVSGSIEASATALGLPIKVSSEVDYRNNNIQLDNLNGRWESLIVSGGGAVNLAANSLDIRLHQAAMSSTFVDGIGFQLPKQLELDVTGNQLKISGPFSDIQYQGDLNGIGHFGQFPLSLRAQLQGSLSEVQVESLALQSQGFHLATLGSINFSGPLDIKGEYSGLTKDTALRLTSALAAEDLELLTFNSSGKFQFQGSYDKPTYDANVEVNGYSNAQPFHLVSQVSGSIESLDILKFELRQHTNSTSPNLALQGQIGVVEASLDLNIETEKLNLKLLDFTGHVLPDNLDGELSSELIVQGPWALPTMSGNGRLNGAVQGSSIEATVDAHFENGVIDIRQAHASADELQASLKGTAELEGPLNLSGQFSGLSSHLTKLLAPRLIPEQMSDFSFLADGKLQVSGTHAEPKYSGAFNVDGRYKHQPLLIKSRFQSSSELFELQTLEIVRRPETDIKDLLLTGTLDLSRSLVDLDLTANALPLELVSLAGIELPEGLSGELFLDGQIHGPWSLPKVVAKGRAEGRYHSEPYSVALDASLDQGRVEIKQSTLVLGGKELVAITGYFGLERQDIAIYIREIDLKHFSKVGWKQARGVLKAELQYQGDQQSSDLKGQIDYRTNWSWVDPQAQRQTSPVQFETRIETIDQVSFLDARVRFQNQETSRLQIDLPLAPYRDWLLAYLSGDGFSPLPTEFQLLGSLDLKALQALIQNELESFGGLAELSLGAGGTRKKPKLNGELTLTDGYYKNEISGTDLSDIQLAASLQDMTVTLVKAEASTPENGRIKLEGDASWGDNKPIALALNAQNAVLLNRPEAEATLSGALSLEGDQTGYLLSGAINLQPLMLKIDSRFDSIPELEVQIVSVDENPATLTRRLKARAAPYPLTVDVMVFTDQQAFLRGRGLEAELKGKVMVVGPINGLDYKGKFETIRGHLTLFNKRFELVRGDVSFDNANAIVNIQAESIRPGITFKVSASGTQDNLKLELTSEPSLPQDEVLARLLFGKSVKNMSPIQAVRLVTALQTLQGGNGLLPDPIDYARDLVSVDELNIESVETDEGTGITVGVGKYLSERVYLEVERTPDPNKPWQGRLDIELTPRLHLETTTSGSEGDEGIELFWIRDY